MMDLILILAIVLVILVALLAAALLIPADISLRPFKEGPLAQLCVSFRLLKGISSGRVDVSTSKREFQLRVMGVTILTKDLKKKEEDEDKRKKKKKPTDWNKLVWHANELYDAGKELVAALTKNTSVKRLRGKVKVGLSDPAHTGMLVGFLYAGSGIAKAVLPESELEIEPSFDKERMDADIETELRLPLFKVLIPLIRFFRRVRAI